MPVLDEARYLAESVRRILDQDYPAELELILALGPSRDGTTRIAERIAAADPRVIMVDNPGGKIPAGINAAIKAARHPVIARVDGHALLPPGYLRLAAATLSVTGAVNVGGIMAAEGVTPFQQAVAWAMTSRFGVGASRFHTGGSPGPVDTVYLGVFRRSAIEQAGGYDEEYLRAEDWELNHRMRQAGGVVWFQPGMRVTYRPRDCATALGRQYFHYGRWRRVVGRQHPGTNNLRYLAPPTATALIAAGTLAGLAGAAALAAGAAGPWPLIALAGLAAPAVYGAGVLAVTASAARQVRPAVAARLPAALVTMHLTWGAGFLTSPRRLVPHGELAGRGRGAGRARRAGGRWRAAATWWGGAPGHGGARHRSGLAGRLESAGRLVAGLEQPGPEAGLEDPGFEAGLEAAGLESPGLGVGLESPGLGVGLEGPGLGAGMEAAGLEAGRAAESGLTQPRWPRSRAASRG